MPLIDVLCKRFYNFVHACVNSMNEVVNFVTRQGMFFSGMQSRIGRNVQFLCERYGVCRQDLLNGSINKIVDRHRSTFTHSCTACI